MKIRINLGHIFGSALLLYGWYGDSGTSFAVGLVVFGLGALYAYLFPEYEKPAVLTPGRAREELRRLCQEYDRESWYNPNTWDRQTTMQNRIDYLLNFLTKEEYPIPRDVQVLILKNGLGPNLEAVLNTWLVGYREELDRSTPDEQVLSDIEHQIECILEEYESLGVPVTGTNLGRLHTDGFLPDEHVWLNSDVIQALHDKLQAYDELVQKQGDLANGIRHHMRDLRGVTLPEEVWVLLRRHRFINRPLDKPHFVTEKHSPGSMALHPRVEDEGWARSANHGNA